jgi:hypothetical protein
MRGEGEGSDIGGKLLAEGAVTFKVLSLPMTMAFVSPGITTMWPLFEVRVGVEMAATVAFELSELSELREALATW